MSYSIDLDPAVQATIVALPHPALVAMAEAFVLLETEPYSGDPINPDRTPDGPLRNLPFGGAGMLTYLILEHQQRVDVLRVTWVG